ncbi:terminase small subunit [Acinetobacter schindleri]|uniref:terminase small subunit n=1 Tax=Acinetobacter schindleri TaxID=108981 RepID=UPI00160FDDEF|nr:terminase small subunit [Acinetobacter schindleri]MBB4834989.1 phage terminase small subunit [Acinetobacter schindleri]
MANLTPKQQRFVEEYLIDLNATQAAIRAGYSEKTAKVIAAQNLSKLNVQEAIEEAQSKRTEQTQIDAAYVLRRLVEIDQMDVLDIMDDKYCLKPIGEWPKIWRQYISNIENLEEFEGFGEDRTQIGWLKKIKWPDKTKNLELLGRHVSVGAFKDKVEHSGPNGGDINVTITRRVID